MFNIAKLHFQNNLIENARGGKLTYIKETSKGVLYLNNNKLKKKKKKKKRL